VPEGAPGGLRRRRHRVPERVRGVRAGQVLLQRRVRDAGRVPPDGVLVHLQVGVPARVQLRLRRQNQHLHLQGRGLHHRLLPPDLRVISVFIRPPQIDLTCHCQCTTAMSSRMHLLGCSHHLFLQDKEVGCEVSRSTDRRRPEHRQWQCAADLQQRRLQTADLQLRRRRFSCADDDNLVSEHTIQPAVAPATAGARLLFLTALG